MHSAPATPMIPTPQATPNYESSDSPMLDPMSILRDMELQISNLRHQHSSMLTLLPLSVHSSSRSGTLTTSETSTISQGESDQDYFGTPTQGISRRQSLNSEMVSPTAISTRLGNLPTELNLGEAIGTSASHSQQQMEKSPRKPHHNRHRHTRQSHHDTSEHEHQRKINHKARSSLSSMYAEVASIYYDADLGYDPEEPHSTPIENSDYAALNGVHDAEEIERVLQREVSRRSENSYSTSDSVPQKTRSSQDASNTATQLLPAATSNQTTDDTTARQAFSGPIIRRKNLPAPAPKAEPSLIGMLKKNVGKVLFSLPRPLGVV